MSAPYSLYVGGRWVDVDEAQPGGATTSDRPKSEWVSLGGKRRTQQAAAGPRTWALGFDFENMAAVKWLAAAAQQLTVGDTYFIDNGLSSTNMLDPKRTAGQDASQPVVAVGSSLVSMRSFGAGVAREISSTMVRAGQTYFITGWTTQAAASVLGTYDTGAGAVNIVAPAGAGSRRFSTSFTAGVDGLLVITITVAGKTTALRLFAASSDDGIDWLPGQKTPCKVDVDDPAMTLQWLFPGEARSDYRVTIREVG